MKQMWAALVVIAAACAAVGWIGCGGDGGDGEQDADDGGDVVREAEVADDGGGEAPTCEPGETACGGRCVDLQTDPDHCGACGTACRPTEVCDRGTCAAGCSSGLAACGRSCIDITSDLENCGACGHVCTAPPNADATCVRSSCGFACHAGWVDLDGEPGCEYACTAVGTETCNGADDDCDGETDDGFPCSPGEPGPCTTTCGSTGTGVCGADCTAPAGPTCTPPPETCNGLDDDCDTVCDDGVGCCVGATTPCMTACGSIGARTCLADCTWGDCEVVGEQCNGLDDDCDTVCDNGFDCCRRASEACVTECGSSGFHTCGETCEWGACVPPAETCNGVDDDCDTACDEGWECCRGQAEACDAGCGTGGSRTCGTGCTWGDCLPPPEVCNGLDDDCDTVCDDGFDCCAGGPAACTNACGVAGTRPCDATCAFAGPCCATSETCGNTCDDDCDTLTDEDCCPGAITIPPGATSVTGNTCGGANNYTATCGGSAASPDIAYIYTPTRSGTVTFSTCSGASFDTVLHARTTCLDPATQIACNDDFCGLQSQISFTVTAGTSYYVIMDGFSSGSCGAFTLTITNP